MKFKSCGVFVAVFMSLSGCTNTPQSDATLICDLASATQPESFYRFSDSGFYKNISAKIISEEMRRTWKALPVTNPGDRWHMLEEAAKECGIKNFPCDSLKPLILKP
jgi:hypothetical protein